MIDTRPRVVIPTAVVCAALVGWLIAIGVSLSHNGPNYPALFNNTQFPMTVTVGGAPQPPVAPHTTLRAKPGTVWTVPRELSCNWHPGQAGAPREISNATLPVTGYTTVELCLARQ